MQRHSRRRLTCASLRNRLISNECEDEDDEKGLERGGVAKVRYPGKDEVAADDLRSRDVRVIIGVRHWPRRQRRQPSFIYLCQHNLCPSPKTIYTLSSEESEFKTNKQLNTDPSIPRLLSRCLSSSRESTQVVTSQRPRNGLRSWLVRRLVRAMILR